jgi:parallel beta-helix repeat protein
VGLGGTADTRGAAMLRRLPRFLVVTVVLLSVGAAGFGSQAATAGWIRVWPSRHLADKPPSPPGKKTTSTSTTTSTSSTTSTTTPTTSTTTPTTSTTTSTTPVPSSCRLYAAVSGDDSNPGTSDQPFATVSTLVRHLASGQTGCVRGGTYKGAVVIRTSGVTVTSAPNERATVVGLFEVADSANDVSVLNLNLDGTNSAATPGVQINGDRVVLRGNDITNHHSAICVVVGGDGAKWGIAYDTVVDANRIHGCGRLPATSQDHGIYLDTSRNARVTNNVITDTADYGIHIYPDSQGSIVEHNVIDGNGMGLIFAGDVSTASNNNVVRFNVIADSTRQYNVQSWWSGPKGNGNTLTQNCLWNGAKGNIDASSGGFATSGNMVANPLFADPAHGNYRLQARSPCAGMGLS